MLSAGPFRRVDAPLARRVLRRQAERVPAHRVQHREAARPLVARHHVAQRVVADVPHVDLAAGVGEHLQHVVFRLAVGRHVRHGEAAALRPGALPARLGGAEIVARSVVGGGGPVGSGVGVHGVGHAVGSHSHFGETNGPCYYGSEEASKQSSGHRVSQSAHRVSQRRKMALRARGPDRRTSPQREAPKNLLCETLCALCETLCPLIAYLLASRSITRRPGLTHRKPHPTILPRAAYPRKAVHVPTATT